jgi:hypothetical protein
VPGHQNHEDPEQADQYRKDQINPGIHCSIILPFASLDP